MKKIIVNKVTNLAIHIYHKPADTKKNNFIKAKVLLKTKIKRRTFIQPIIKLIVF